MNPRSTDQEIEDLRRAVRELELSVRVLEDHMKLARFIGGALVISVIALVVNTLGELLF